MNDRQVFKFEFMNRCIENGLTSPEQMLKVAETVMVKAGGAFSSIPVVGGALDGVSGAVSGAVSSLGPLAAGALLAGPPLVGAVGGGLLAKSQDVSDYDTDEYKKQEVVDTYRRETDRLKRQGLLRRYMAGTEGSKRRPMF